MPDFVTAFERRASAVLYHYLCGVRRTGSWLLPANVCPIVPAVFCKAGKRIEFVDVSPDTLCLDTDETSMRVQRAPDEFAGVLFVHTYGRSGDADGFFAQLKSLDPELHVIDDRCLCRPCFSPKGGVADVELYSTGYSKFVDLGWGGWGYLRRSSVYHRKTLPFDSRAHDELVTTFQLALKNATPFACPPTGWLDTRPPEIEFDQYRTEVESRLEEATRHRERLNAVYSEHLKPWALPREFQNWRFTIKCPEPEELLKIIFANGHFASRHYQALPPMFGPGSTPIATELGCNVINLFNDFRYNASRAGELARLAVDFLAA